MKTEREIKDDIQETEDGIYLGGFGDEVDYYQGWAAALHWVLEDAE